VSFVAGFWNMWSDRQIEVVFDRVGNPRHQFHSAP
jgi:hypothetical protein